MEPNETSQEQKLYDRLKKTHPGGPIFDQFLASSRKNRLDRRAARLMWRANKAIPEIFDTPNMSYIYGLRGETDIRILTNVGDGLEVRATMPYMSGMEVVKICDDGSFAYHDEYSDGTNFESNLSPLTIMGGYVSIKHALTSTVSVLRYSQSPVDVITYAEVREAQFSHLEI